MAIVRPIVYVYQEFATLTVSPGTPDLNCCIFGPCFYIQDYAEDKTDIDVGAFVKSPYTDADAPCANSPVGESLGRPDPGSDFLVTDPPNISQAPGAVLDSASVEVVFDDAYIEIMEGQSTSSPALADGENWFESTGDDFDAGYAQPGDRLVMTKDGLETTAATVVKTIKQVDDTSSDKLLLNDSFTTAEVTALGTTNVKYRVEHVLSDQVIDDDYYAVVGNQITIKTGPTGILLAYNNTTYPVNFADGIYIGYRAMRVDKELVQTVNNTDEITSKIGRLDERNPLAVGVYVALSNTGTPVQAFGVSTDDLVGHTAARDRVSTRDDIYCIVPVTDELTTSSWVSVISMWKAHCVAFAAYDKAKFRIVIGSYDELPTEKSSAPPSVVGHTFNPEASPDIDVFVDPADAAGFLTAEVDSDNLLDIMHSHADIETVLDQKHLFSSSGYAGARELLGAMGDKRLRTTSGSAFASAQAAADGAYVVRDPILKSEGVAATSIIADTTGATWGTNGDVPARARITKTGAFSNVVAGDVVHVTNGTYGGGSHDDGYVVIDTFGGASADHIDIEAADINADTVDVQVYRPIDSTIAGDVVAATRTITASGASDFTNVAIGDLCVVLQSGGAGSIGMWVVQNKLDNQNIVIGDPESGLADDTGGTNIVFFRSVAAAADTPLYTRARLTRLRDDTASFLTTVQVGENIQIPYPEDTDPTKWDTTTTTWPIGAIVSNQLLDATLEDLEELAPDTFIEGFDGDMPYRISIDLDRDAQVTELNTITTGLKNSRCVMAWPNVCKVSGVENEKTGVQNWLHGQYLACAIGGMIAGLPSHQGFTFIAAGGVEQLDNSNFYFSDDQLTDLHDGGWYVFVQDSENSPPYTIHEVTTDTDTYENGELMNVKNFDYIALFYRDIMRTFIGRYNITPETLELLRDAFNTGTDFLQLRTFPRIGAPLLSAEITSLEQHASEVDRVEIYAEIEMPKVLNKIGLHLKA